MEDIDDDLVLGLILKDVRKGDGSSRPGRINADFLQNTVNQTASHNKRLGVGDGPCRDWNDRGLQAERERLVRDAKDFKSRGGKPLPEKRKEPSNLDTFMPKAKKTWTEITSTGIYRECHCWLSKGLRVRVIDESRKKLYLKKGRIVKPYHGKGCSGDVEMEDGVLVEKVPVAVLESVVPAPSKTASVQVEVVRGANKGRIALLLWKDKARNKGGIVFNDQRGVENVVALDDICAYA